MIEFENPHHIYIDEHRWYCDITIVDDVGLTHEYRVSMEDGAGMYIVDKEEDEDE